MYSKIVDKTAEFNFIRHLPPFSLAEFVRVNGSNNFGDSEVMSIVNKEINFRVGRGQLNLIDKSVLLQHLIDIDRITEETLSGLSTTFIDTSNSLLKDSGDFRQTKAAVTSLVRVAQGLMVATKFDEVKSIL